jgi:hypothetical protein
MRFTSDRGGHRQWNECRRVSTWRIGSVLRLLDYHGPYTNDETLDRAVLSPPIAVQNGGPAGERELQSTKTRCADREYESGNRLGRADDDAT